MPILNGMTRDEDTHRARHVPHRPLAAAPFMLDEDHAAILPLAPYLDRRRRVLIAVALVGIGVTIYVRLDDCQRGRR
jgi:hypothetical protein